MGVPNPDLKIIDELVLELAHHRRISYRQLESESMPVRIAMKRLRDTIRAYHAHDVSPSLFTHLVNSDNMPTKN